MSDRLGGLYSEFEHRIEQSTRLCYAATTRELQIEAVAALEAFKSQVSAHKAAAVAKQDEHSSNELLCAEDMLQALIHELTMWISLKDDKPTEAWDSLVEAQTAAMGAIHAYALGANLPAYVERLDALEHLLFPPQVFMSAGVIIKRSHCSICGAEYGDCDHLKGRVYMGRECVRIIDSLDVREISIVPSPANKHCRVVILEEGGVKRDTMTKRVLTEGEAAALAGRTPVSDTGAVGVSGGVVGEQQ